MEQNREISSLQSELNRVDRVKEEIFSKSNENRKKIAQLRGQASSLKKERDALTDAVKVAKKERDVLNKELKEKITEYKKKAPKQKATRVNPGFLRKEIERMEYKIETEGLSFKKEQELMKVINEKKKLIESAEGPKELRGLNKEIHELRKKADEAHRLTQQKAEESQKKHEAVIKTSDELRELMKSQKEFEKQIRESKSKEHDISEQLNKKLEEFVAHPEQQRPRQQFRGKQQKRPFKQQTRQLDEKTLLDKQQKAEEKLKKGQKLTTEDLLAFQGKK